MSFFRGLLETYVQEHNVPVIDVASALAVISHDDKSFLLKADPAPGSVPGSIVGALANEGGARPEVSAGPPQGVCRTRNTTCG